MGGHTTCPSHSPRILMSSLTATGEESPTEAPLRAPAEAARPTASTRRASRRDIVRRVRSKHGPKQLKERQGSSGMAVEEHVRNDRRCLNISGMAVEDSQSPRMSCFGIPAAAVGHGPKEKTDGLTWLRPNSLHGPGLQVKRPIPK